jgi:hypothetical protein
MKLIQENLGKRNLQRNIIRIIVKMIAKIIILANKDRHLLQILNKINLVNSQSKLINLIMSNKYNKIIFQEILL